jgi:hypothetical protein
MSAERQTRELAAILWPGWTIAAQPDGAGWCIAKSKAITPTAAASVGWVTMPTEREAWEEAARSLRAEAMRMVDRLTDAAWAR